jgi:hypothetical protein
VSTEAGTVQFADAAYHRFDEMAQLIVMDIRARETGTGKADLDQLKRDDLPDLSGGMRYLDSPRHASYVNSHAYQAYLAELRDRFNWPDTTEQTYAAMRVSATPTGAMPSPDTQEHPA